MSQLDYRPEGSPVARSIRRIVAEAMLVAIIGALVGGLLWEVQLRDVGLIIAGIIWIFGTPFLEILRLLQLRKTESRPANPVIPMDSDVKP
jgi:hypothetical protein